MLVTRTALSRVQALFKNTARFARKKNKEENDEGDDRGTSSEPQRVISEIKIDEKYEAKSAALYDHYVKSRERPMLTLDNYQIRYINIIERTPIYLPYNPKRFNYYRTKYQMLKKAGLYPDVVSGLQVESGDYLFGEYERVNSENEITHRNQVSKTEVYEYAENSRYWRYTDPTIKDSHSIQTFSSDNVFLIVKNRAGKWIFPTRLVQEKDNHKEIFQLINEELFGATTSPYVYMSINKPVYARKIEDETLERGQGYYDFFYKGLSISGICKFPTANYVDYAWVPKAHLAQYFEDDYFNENIKMASHHC